MDTVGLVASIFRPCTISFLKYPINKSKYVCDVKIKVPSFWKSTDKFFFFREVYIFKICFLQNWKCFKKESVFVIFTFVLGYSFFFIMGIEKKINVYQLINWIDFYGKNKATKLLHKICLH